MVSQTLSRGGSQAEDVDLLPEQSRRTLIYASSARCVPTVRIQQGSKARRFGDGRGARNDQTKRARLSVSRRAPCLRARWLSAASTPRSMVWVDARKRGTTKAPLSSTVARAIADGTRLVVASRTGEGDWIWISPGDAEALDLLSGYEGIRLDRTAGGSLHADARAWSTFTAGGRHTGTAERLTRRRTSSTIGDLPDGHGGFQTSPRRRAFCCSTQSLRNRPTGTVRGNVAGVLASGRYLALHSLDPGERDLCVLALRSIAPRELRPRRQAPAWSRTAAKVYLDASITPPR